MNWYCGSLSRPRTAEMTYCKSCCKSINRETYQLKRINKEDDTSIKLKGILRRMHTRFRVCVWQWIAVHAHACGQRDRVGPSEVCQVPSGQATKSQLTQAVWTLHSRPGNSNNRQCDSTPGFLRIADGLTERAAESSGKMFASHSHCSFANVALMAGAWAPPPSRHRPSPSALA